MMHKSYIYWFQFPLKSYPCIDEGMIFKLIEYLPLSPFPAFFLWAGSTRLVPGAGGASPRRAEHWAGRPGLSNQILASQCYILLQSSANTLLHRHSPAMPECALLATAIGEAAHCHRYPHFYSGLKTTSSLAENKHSTEKYSANTRNVQLMNYPRQYSNCLYKSQIFKMT